MSFFLKARDMFKEAGYQNIGMDHFVKSSDSLFFASEQGLLHRNFQGYCTRSTTGQVYAFGSSAISQLDNAYLQNTHITSDYMEKVKRQEMTEVRVHPLTENEKIWRNMIERLMCNNALKINEIEKKALGERWNRLCALEKEGLLTKINDDEIRTTTLGSLVIRYLVSVIDPLLENQESEGVFSKTI
jgi:oxygen-independent coproporphyrinogen-3 oxidase